MAMTRQRESLHSPRSNCRLGDCFYLAANQPLRRDGCAHLRMDIDHDSPVNLPVEQLGSDWDRAGERDLR